MRYLSGEGVKEITLLGQNVNSYRDTSHTYHYMGDILGKEDWENKETQLVKGFKTVYKPKKGRWVRYSIMVKSLQVILCYIAYTHQSIVLSLFMLPTHNTFYPCIFSV